MTKQSLRPLTTLFPVPVVLVTCGDDKPNIITIAWTGVLCSDPPCLGVSIRPSRHSHALVLRNREFAINIPSVGLLEKTDYCGMVSGKDVDKFAAAGLTPLPASEIKAPLIAECPVNIECKVTTVLSLGSHDLFVGRVVAVHADEEVLGEGKRIDCAKAKPLAYASREYWGLGEILGAHGMSLRKGQG